MARTLSLEEAYGPPPAGPGVKAPRPTISLDQAYGQVPATPTPRTTTPPPPRGKGQFSTGPMAKVDEIVTGAAEWLFPGPSSPESALGQGRRIAAEARGKAPVDALRQVDPMNPIFNIGPADI